MQRCVDVSIDRSTERATSPQTGLGKNTAKSIGKCVRACVCASERANGGSSRADRASFASFVKSQAKPSKNQQLIFNWNNISLSDQTTYNLIWVDQYVPLLIGCKKVGKSRELSDLFTIFSQFAYYLELQHFNGQKN